MSDSLPLSRVQLALNVADLDASIAFYQAMLGTAPHKTRPGYANFEVSNPPLKLVLMEVPAADRGTGTAGALNHLGIEMPSSDAVADTLARWAGDGLTVRPEDDTVCCYARQDKGWIHDPAGTPWEAYAITDDNPDDADGDGLGLGLGLENTSPGGTTAAPCCTPQESQR